ncbi:MAG: hypothetical protein ACKOB4_07750 [Acidobacteriota bacterium]
MNSFLKILLVLIFTAQVGPAQTTAPAPQAPLKAPATTSPARLPGVDQILDRYVVAVGGADALRKVRTRRVLGEFEFEGMNMTGSLESLGSAPAQSVVSLDVPGVGQFRQVVNGEKAWALDPLSGLRELTGAELAAYLRDAEFYRELNFKKLFAKLEVVTRLKLGDQEAFIVNAIPAVGEAEQFYFDVTSGLLIRHDTRRESPQGVMPTETFFSDYRTVDGVRLAWKIRQQTPAFTINMTFREVTHNLTIDEAKFARPAAP